MAHTALAAVRPRVLMVAFTATAAGGESAQMELGRLLGTGATAMVVECAVTEVQSREFCALCIWLGPGHVGQGTTLDADLCDCSAAKIHQALHCEAQKIPIAPGSTWPC